jgi:hypothetical protein
MASAAAGQLGAGGSADAALSPASVFAAWRAAPESAEAASSLRAALVAARTHALAAALTAVLERTGANRAKAPPPDGWAHAGGAAFAALRDAGDAAAAPGGMLLLLRVLRASAAELAPLNAARRLLAEGDLPLELAAHDVEVDEVMNWVAWAIDTRPAAAAQRSGVAVPAAQRAVWARLMWLYPPHAHAEVAGLAAMAFVAAAAGGETNDDALCVMAAFSAAPRNGENGARSGEEVSAPECLDALVALAGSDGTPRRRRRHALLALCAASRWPLAWPSLLAKGAPEAAVAALEHGTDTAACVAAAVLVQALAEAGGPAAWPCLAACGALPALLSSPALLPGAHSKRLAARVASCVVAVHAAWGRARVAAAATLPDVVRATRVTHAAQPRLSGAHRAAFHRRAAQCAERGGGDSHAFWDAVVTPLGAASATPAAALAALADAEAAAKDAAAGGVMLPRALAHCSSDALAAAACAALCDGAWPVAPLVRAMATHRASVDILILQTVRYGHLPPHGASGALFQLLQAWADDACTLALATTRREPRARLAAAVSAALLAPRLPHLGALLVTQGHEPVRRLVDALLAAAHTMRDTSAAAAAAAASHANHCDGIADEEDGEDEDDDVAAEARERAAAARSEGAYRFEALCAAVGTLAAEAFPPAGGAPGGGAAAAAAGGRSSRAAQSMPPGSSVVPAFSWRRAARAPQQQQPQRGRGGAGGSSAAPPAKRRRSASGATTAAAAAAAPGTLTREDVGAALPGCVTFAVGGERVAALAFVMQRASPLLRDALSVSDDAAVSIPLPPLNDMEPAQQAALFRAAVEHAYTGRIASLPSASLQPLWRLAHALALEGLKAWAAPRLVRSLTQDGADGGAALFGALEMAQSHCCGDMEPPARARCWRTWAAWRRARPTRRRRARRGVVLPPPRRASRMRTTRARKRCARRCARRSRRRCMRSSARRSTRPPAPQRRRRRRRRQEGASCTAMKRTTTHRTWM